MDSAMNRRYWAGALLGLITLLSGCNLFSPAVEPEEDPVYDRMLYAWNYKTKKDYPVYAVRLAENDRCVVYGDRAWTKTIGDAEKLQAQKLADEFTANIYPKITAVFGECADIDGNEKTIILLLDIIDGLAPDSGSYVAGYFDPHNMGAGATSNQAELLYMDIAEGKLGSDSFNATAAHEFQHLLRYSAAKIFKTSAYPADWLNEGLSTAAEYVYLGKHLDEFVQNYNKDWDQSIAGGNNFFYWEGNDIADYATAYLFFQWLRIQAQGYDIYKEICATLESGADAQAVAGAAAKLISEDLDSWDKLIRAWLTANYMNAPEDAGNGLSLYGYHGEFPALTIHPYWDGGTTKTLRPGEGVYSFIKDHYFTPTGSIRANIGYGDLRTEQPPVFNPEPKIYTGEYLLTYNGNSTYALFTPKETGQITGLKPPPSAKSVTPRAASRAPSRIDGTSLLPEGR
jgi:hypothetical protein